MSGTGSSSVMTTLNVVACRCPVFCVVLVWIGLLPISVTRPLNVRSGTASIVTLASCLSATLGISVSSTSTSASITDMSAIVSRTDPGVVHRSDDGGLSLFDAAAGHQTVHGCRDDDLIQVVARRRQARLFLLDALLVCFDVLRPGPKIRLANSDLILRFLEVLLRRQSFLPEVLLTLQILARELQVCAALLDGRARPEQGRLGGGNTGLSALQLSLELFRIDLEQELTGLHALTLFDCDPSDAPRSLGRDVDLTLRLHLAGGRDDRFQVARTECFGLTH